MVSPKYVDHPLPVGVQDARQDAVRASWLATAAGVVWIEPHLATEAHNSADYEQALDQWKISNPFPRRWPNVAQVRFDDIGPTAYLHDAMGTGGIEGNETRLVAIGADPISTSPEQPLGSERFHPAPPDNDLPVVSIAPSSLVQIEGTGGSTPFTFTVSLDRPSTSTQTVRWNLSKDSSANTVDATDFSASAPLSFSLAVTFGPGETSKTIAVNVIGDSILEPDEKFYVLIWDPSAGLKIGNSWAQATIIDDELLKVSISAQNSSQREGHSGTTPYTFTVTLTKAEPASQTVQWSVSGTGFEPANGSDFSGGILPSGTVTFGVGETIKTITVEVLGDTQFEWDEQFFVTLSNASPSLTIGTGTATATIVTDDATVRLSGFSQEKAEGNGGVTSFTYKVFRSGTNSDSHEVWYSVSGSGPKPAEAADFGGSLPSGKLTFLKGEYEKTITIDVTGDSVVENNETFTVALSNPSSGLSIEGTSVASVIINDDGLYSKSLMVNGDSAHRVDVVYVAEGYTLSERDKFLSDAASLNSYIFSLSNATTTNDPFVTYKSFFNASALYVPSMQSGYSTDQSKVDTAFGAAAHLADGRLIYGDEAAVLKTVATKFSEDQSELVIVLVNSDKFGGAGGSVAWTTSSNVSSYQVALHEIGHSFAGLQDEYVDEALVGGDLTQALKNSVHVWPSNNPAEVPWKHWLGFQDELGVVGIYEGGFYRSTGVWRATSTSKMADNVSSYSAPQKEEFIKRFYETVGDHAFLRQESLVEWEGVTPVAGLMNFQWAVGGQVVAGTAPKQNLIELFKVKPDGPVDISISLDLSDNSGFLRHAAALEASRRHLEATFSFFKRTLKSTENDYEGTEAGNYFVIGNQLSNDISIEGETGTSSYVDGGSGDDRIWGSAGDDIFAGGTGANRSYGGGGNDTALFHGNRSGFSIALMDGVTKVVGPGSVDLVEDVDWLQFDDARLQIAELREVGIEASVQSVVEGGSGATSFSFTVVLGRASDASESVGWVVTGSGSKAASATDFFGGALPSGIVRFAPGETSKVVTISVSGDRTFELDEEFAVTLVEASAGLVLGKMTTQGTIENDDEATVSIGAEAMVTAEGNIGSAAYKFTVSLDRVVETTISIDWNVSGSGAHAADAADFGGMLPSGMVDFAPGQTTKFVTIEISSDATIEFDEEFTVSLSTTSTDVILSHASATGAIQNDDRSTVSVVPLAADLSEGKAGQTAYTFTVSLDRAGVAAQTIGWSVSGSGAHPADAADFGGTLPSGSVVFSAGETSKTVTVTVSADSAVELDETFAVTLSNPSSGTTIGTANAAGTIRNDDASVSIAALSALKAEGQAGSTSFTFALTLTGDSSVSRSVSYGVAGSGAAPVNGADFAGGVLPAGTVTFTVGETTRTITLEAATDSAMEEDEAFTISLSNPSSGFLLGTASAVGIIENDDAIVSIAAATASKPEGQTGATSFTFTVTLSDETAVPHAVTWTVAGAGANPATAPDFAGGVLPTGMVTFAAGETSKVVTVSVATDTFVEADEGFKVTLSSPSTGLSIDSATASGTIFNDDATVSIAASAASMAEGQAGPTAFTFILTRSGGIAGAHNVAWMVAGAGAAPAAASDFAGGVLPSGMVTFAPGQSSTIVTVSVQGDTPVEANESFTVALSNPSAGLTIATTTANGTIVNDDAAVSIAATAAVKTEGNAGTSSFTFTLTRSGDIAASHTAAWTVAGGGINPAAASDFAGGVLPSGVVTFAPGEVSTTVTIAVQGDTTGEANETFTVALSNPSPGLAIGTASASGTIQNDDAAPPVAAHGDAYVVKQGQALAPLLAVGVLANDESAATASLLDGPDHGVLQLAGDGAFTYTPAAGFSGVDTFTYRAGNTGATMDQAQVTIHVVPVSAGSSPTLNLVGLTAEEQIAATYVAFFGRGADAGGFDFWLGQFVSNLPTQGPATLFANIASSFGISDEAKGLYPFLVDPFHASDSQINVFLNSVYDNLFNRTPDAGGLGYWTDQVKQTLQANQFVGSVLVNIMSGAQDTAAGKDITTLMGKVAVSLAYVREQHEHPGEPGDMAAAKVLLEAVTAEPASVLVGVRNAESLIAGHA